MTQTEEQEKKHRLERLDEKLENWSRSGDVFNRTTTDGMIMCQLDTVFQDGWSVKRYTNPSSSLVKGWIAEGDDTEPEEIAEKVQEMWDNGEQYDRLL